MKLISDNKMLQNSFNWAVKKTAQFVVSGKENGDINKGDGGKWYGPDGKVINEPNEDWAKPKKYGSAFWAGYYDRSAYYIRDFVHQAIPAIMLGLYDEVYQMYHAFVSSASEETGWYALWSFNFDHTPYYMDTPNLRHFVREITSQFELVDLGYKLYLWTGDERYITDKSIALFADKIMGDFIDNQDGIVFDVKNGIPEGKGDIFEGSATYNERGFYAVEAGDSIAAMYSAMLSYSKILLVRGNKEGAKKQVERAKELKKYFNEKWSVVDGSDMFCYAIDDKKKKHYKWTKKSGKLCGAETLEFIPLKNLSYRDKRNDKLLDYIFKMQSSKKTMSDNIESLTYLPDLFFANNEYEHAWYFMKYIISKKDLPHEHKSQGTNGDYPEISFTFISQTIEGIMGISVDKKSKELILKPNLPNEINYIKLSDFLYRGNYYDITIRRNNSKIISQIDKNGNRNFINCN